MLVSGSQAVVFGFKLSSSVPPFVWIQPRRGANCKIVYWFGDSGRGLNEDGMHAVRTLFHQFRTRDFRGEYVVTSASGLCVTPTECAEAVAASLSLLLSDARNLGPAFDDWFVFRS